MRRSRRIALTVATATGLLGGAGAAVAGIDASTATGTSGSTPQSSPVAQSSSDDGTGALRGYVDDMSARAGRLEESLAAARTRLSHVRSARAARLAALQAQAAAAQAAAAQAAAAQASQQPGSAPAVHTSTGASGAGGSGEDEHESEHEGGDD